VPTYLISIPHVCGGDPTGLARITAQR